MPISAPSRLRRLLERPEILVAPGAFSALSALLIARAGFEAVYLTGYGASADLLGCPDVGLLTMTEMANHAARLVSAVEIPVVADADTGYGNVLNVRRTIQEYERAGVAGVQLEDQVFPKRCGHMAGKAIISADEMARKIEVACETRVNPDLVIIARTDARAVMGLGEALRRAKVYSEAGADVIFVEAPESVEELREIAACTVSHCFDRLVSD